MQVRRKLLNTQSKFKYVDSDSVKKPLKFTFYIHVTSVLYEDHTIGITLVS